MEGVSRRGLLAAAGAAVGAAGCGEAPFGGGSSADATTTTEEAPAATGAPAAGGGPYARVYRRTIGSVVLVRVFGRRARSEASGFVFDDGHVVTNHHVVEGADGIELGFEGNEWRSASVAGTDAYSDLAVMRLPDRPAGAEPLGLLASDPPVGTRVLALGNPFGLEASASAGIVSGVDRTLPGPNDFPIPDAIQTDAAINPGNSGGPLVTLDGSVVGVITAGAGATVGFAVSAPLTRRVVPSLIGDGSYAHPYMGVRLRTVTPTVAEANDLPEPGGVLVVEVVDGGPSDGVLRGSPEEARVRDRTVPVGGDVILAMDGTPTPTVDRLTAYLALETAPGDVLEVGVLRDGQRRTVELELGTRPSP